jgi:hypothetical protein
MTSRATRWWGSCILEWFELGDGSGRTLVPRDDRLVPPQLQEIHQIYRIYMLFPATIEIDGEWKDWDPRDLDQVWMEPTVRTTGTGRR